MINTDNKKQIVLIGGGFAGFSFARQLFNNPYYNVTLVDKNNYNYFTPLLYQVATGFLEPAAISYPFRKLFEKKGIAFKLAQLIRINTAEKILYLSDGSEMDYDLLVIAAGSAINFFGNKGLRRHSLFIKGIEDGLYMRNELIKTFEKASAEKDIHQRRKLLTIIIAGGGATGVELAGIVAELKNGIIEKEYPVLRNDPMTIYLVEGSSYLLATMSNQTHREAYRALQELGIIIKLNTRVNGYRNDSVLLSDGEMIETSTLIWAAGVTVNKFEGISIDSIGKGNRMITNHFNQVKGYDSIYAIGDNSIQFTDKAYPDGHPQLAQPAIQQGRTLARNLLRLAKGKEMKTFRYVDKREMAVIGRKWAVADLFKHRLHIGGLPGLLAWLFIHLVSLLNYNNIVRTLFSWLVAYLTNDQVLRIMFLSQNAERDFRPDPNETQKVQPNLLKENLTGQSSY